MIIRQGAGRLPAARRHVEVPDCHAGSQIHDRTTRMQYTA